MRALYVPVRLAATVMAVAAAAGCMSVGDDGSRPGPSHSAGQRAGEAPDGGSAVNGGGAGFHAGREAKGDASAKPGESASGTASPSASEGGKAKPSAQAPGKGGKGQPGPPGPTKGVPSPPASTADPTPPPPPPPPSDPPSSDPTTAEPSSSAHEQATQLVQREPAPEAGSPV
ncbi:hypothetical protein [Streptomyces sp. NPDC048309]|uniref:hypothetical protein n=1 Tax=unclassified Streptomyces TaxID=2593676 RepID=UPI00340EF393